MSGRALRRLSLTIDYKTFNMENASSASKGMNTTNTDLKITNKCQSSATGFCKHYGYCIC